MTPPGPLPENTSRIIPRLVPCDPAAESAFCVQAFCAVEVTTRHGPDGSDQSGHVRTVAQPVEDTAAEPPTARWDEIRAQAPPAPARRL